MPIRPKRPANRLITPVAVTHGKSRRKTALQEIEIIDEYRRANGTYELCKLMMTPPQPGKSYHVLTGGNIDLVSYLQWLMLFWKKIDRVFVTAFVMSGVEIQQFRQWMEGGCIGTVEVVLSDIFPRQYKVEWEALVTMYEQGLIGSIFTSKTHAKIMLIQASDGTKIVIESSANCNMNPRIEQSCITVNPDLFDFYDVYLHEIMNDEESRLTERQAKEILKQNGNEANLTDDERSAIERENDLCDTMGE